MKNCKTFNLDEFKDLVTTDNQFKNELVKREDLIDLDNGVMRICSENLDKYLEKYGCKDAEDLEDTMYYSYGIYCTVI